MMMIKKITACLLALCLVFGLAACQKNTDEISLEDLVNQGKSQMLKMDYENALTSFEAAIQKGSAGQEVEQLRSILSSYLSAKAYAAKEEWDKAKEALDTLHDTYIQYSIRNDVLELKKLVEEKLTHKSETEEKLTHLTQLFTEEKWEEAKTVADDLLALTLTDEQRQQVKEYQDAITAKLEALNQVQTTKKQVYEAKLKAMEAEVAKIGEGTGTTKELLAAAEQRYRKWDKLLNDIYGELKVQLKSADMTKLRIEQRKWIETRDETAKQEAAVYEGGSIQPVVYADSLARTTKNRCYELVQNHMQ